MFYHLFFLLPMALGIIIDSWSDEFESSQNCQSMEDVRRLKINSSQCVEITTEKNSKDAFRVCKNHLSVKLKKKCEKSKVKNPGKLLYCKIKSSITCCFVEATCFTWSGINLKMYHLAKDYLTDTEGFLSQLTKSEGYKTCHALGTSLDTSICAKDCEELENGRFAKNCATKGWLFKCCIRRDKRFCHECRFCCTLTMCVRPPGGEEGIVFEGSDIILEDHNITLRAETLFFSTNHRYKNYDYYCMKPYSHDDPSQWEQYDMVEYRKAFTKEAMEKVHSYKHETLLNNWEDPKVLKSFSRREMKSNKLWWKIFKLRTRKMPPYSAFPEDSFDKRKRSIFGR